MPTPDPEKLKEYFASFKDSCGPRRDDNGVFTPIMAAWTAKDHGFGEFTFYVIGGKLRYVIGDKLRCDNEAMSKDFIKKMLCQMVDDAELDDPK